MLKKLAIFNESPPTSNGMGRLKLTRNFVEIPSVFEIDFTNWPNSSIDAQSLQHFIKAALVACKRVSDDLTHAPDMTVIYTSYLIVHVQLIEANQIHQVDKK